MAERSREYALLRLDRWYADKFRQNYTPAVAAVYRREIMKRMDIESRREFESALGADAFSPHVLRTHMGSFFSTVWNQTVADFEGDELDILAMPPGVREEYGQPYVDVTTKVRSMVDAVRTKANDVFPDELTDEEVRDAFFAPVGGLEGFCAYSAEALRVLAAAQGRIAGTTSEKWFTDYLNACVDVAPSINRMILS